MQSLGLPHCTLQEGRRRVNTLDNAFMLFRFWAASLIDHSVGEPQPKLIVRRSRCLMGKAGRVSIAKRARDNEAREGLSVPE